jgi:hypothetical protein
MAESLSEAWVNEQQPEEKYINIKERIASLLYRGVNPSFRYQDNAMLLNSMAALIEEYLNNDLDTYEDLEVVYNLIQNHEYRFVADYLHARQSGMKVIVDLYMQIINERSQIGINKVRYKISHTRFLNVLSYSQESNVSFVSCLEDAISQLGFGIWIYLTDLSMKPSLVELINDVGVELGAFIEQQYDFPSRNALICQGVVKAWTMPDGTAIISKRNNTNKPGRFQQEQSNYETIIRKIGGKSELSLGQAVYSNNIWLKIVQPFAIIRDGYSNCNYALSLFVDGVSLEDILINEHNHYARDTYLSHYRLIYDVLCDHGILWGDMSPRNIIITHNEQDIVYNIFDFEKTKVFNSSISVEGRKEHCRGQILAVVLCALCTLDELQKCFCEYFNTEVWDYK